MARLLRLDEASRLHHVGHLLQLPAGHTGEGDPGQNQAFAVDVEDPDGGPLTRRLQVPRARAGGEDVKGPLAALLEAYALRDLVVEVQARVTAHRDRAWPRRCDSLLGDQGPSEVLHSRAGVDGCL